MSALELPLSDMKHYTPRLSQIVTSPDVLKRLDEPVQLSSGEWSDVFIDGKHAVDDADNLDFVGSAMFAAVCEAGVEFEAVGGLELGAVPFAFAVQRIARCKWFLVRKTPKGRGTNLWVEGARIAEGMPVMLVDDVVTTGDSICKAYDRIQKEGGRVVFATTLVDRGEEAAEFFGNVGVPYVPMLTYRDLDIEPVRRGNRATATAS
ncbi:MAG: phosphoribosyltransferase family protein [Acidimicrobiales bacterium]